MAQVNLHNLPNSHKVPKQHIIQFTCSGTPVLYGAGYAKSDFTTCLPVPRRCCGQLGRSEQAAFLGPDFGESVLTAVSHRSQHRPGSPKQAQTWPDGSTYSIVQGTPAFAETGPKCFGLWCAKNGVLNQFSHSLLFEIPSSDSLLARTDINTQDRQESAVGVVSAVSACHCETVLRQHRLPLQATRTTATAARHSPIGRRCGSGRWAPPEREAGAIRLQGRTACMRRAGKPVVKARGPSARRTVRTICSLCGQSTICSPKPARDPHAEKQTIAFNGAQYGGLHKFHQISFGYGQTILLYAQSRKREQYRVFRRSS